MGILGAITLHMKFASPREAVSETRKTFILDRETLSQHAPGPSGSSADGQIRI